MKKIFLTVLSMALVINCTCFRAEASNKATFGEAEVNESFVTVLETDPDSLFQQYSNIVDIQTTTLSDISRSSESAVEAYEYDVDGTAHLLEAKATLTKVLYQEESDISSLYVLAASTDNTYSSDSITKDGVTLNGTIVWEDNFGPKNKLVSLSGSRSGSYTGDGSYVITSRTTPIGSGTFAGASFSDTSYGGRNGSSFTLIVRSDSAETSKQVQLIVKTSFLD